MKKMKTKVGAKLMRIANEAGFDVVKGSSLDKLKKDFAISELEMLYVDEYTMRLGEALGMNGMSAEELRFIAEY